MRPFIGLCRPPGMGNVGVEHGIAFPSSPLVQIWCRSCHKRWKIWKIWMVFIHIQDCVDDLPPYVLYRGGIWSVTPLLISGFRVQVPGRSLNVGVDGTSPPYILVKSALQAEGFNFGCSLGAIGCNSVQWFLRMDITFLL